MSVESLKALANRRGAALRKQNEEIQSLKTQVDVLRAQIERLEAARSAAEENAQLMNAAAERYLRRAEQAERGRR